MSLYLINKKTNVIYGPYTPEYVEVQMSDDNIAKKYEIFEGAVITTLPKTEAKKAVTTKTDMKKSPTAKA